MSNFNFIGNFLGKKASLPREGHDMSNQQVYSLPFGTITPVDVIDVVPGEHYNCKYSGYVQTTPMRDDNFSTIYNNMKAIYIPKTSMLRDYASFIMNRDRTRKNIQFDYKPYEVWVQLRQIMQYIYLPYFLSRLYEGVLSEVDDIYNCWLNLDEAEILFNDERKISLLDDNSLPLAAFKYTYSFWRIYNVSGLEFMDSGWPMGVIFDNFLNNMRSDSGSLISHDALRLLDNLGYGNLLPLLSNFFDHEINSIFSGAYDGTRVRYYQFIDYLRTTYINFRISGHVLQQLGYVIGNTTDYVDMTRLFDYQYYIRMVERSNYRLPSTKVVTLDSVSAFIDNETNFNNFYTLEVGDLPGSYYQYRSKRFVLENPDFDSELQPDAYAFMHEDLLPASHNTFYYNFFYGETSADGSWTPIDSVFESGGFDDLSAMLHYLLSLHSPLLEPDIFTTMQNDVVVGSVPEISPSSAVTIESLNNLSALYRMRQDLLRAGVRREKQMSSLFGTSEDTDLTQDIYVLDSSSTPVNIQGLINQAETEVAPLGERGARGNGSSGLDFTFDSDGYGTLLIVQYFTCECFYENFKVDKQLRTNVAGRWNPYYNNLGLESVYAADCSFMNSAVAKPNGSRIVHLNSVIGFSARFFEYKQRVSVVHGLFTNFGFDLSPLGYAGGNTKYPYRYTNPSLVRGNSLLGGFVPTLIDQQVNLFSEEKDLYYNPFMVNNLFVTMYDGAAHGGYSYDNFRCVLNCSVRKVSPMPKIGLLRQI